MDAWILSTTDVAEDAKKYASVLDEEEAERLASFSRSEARSRYLVAHVGLRILLGSRTGRQPEEIRFVRTPCPLCGGPHGRPALRDDPGVHFSMSHSADMVLYATASSAIGVDIETLGRRQRFDFSEYLHPAEREALTSVPAAERHEALMSCWVRKEAYLKGTGAGIADGISTDHVGLGPRWSVSPEPRTPSGWSLFGVAVPDGYLAAAAVRGHRVRPPEAVLRPRRLDLAGRWRTRETAA